MTPNRRVTWQATSDDDISWPRCSAAWQRGRSRRARSSGQGKSRGSGSWVSDPLLLGQIRWKLSGQGCAISATSRVRTSSLTSAGRKGSTSYLNWRPNWSTWTSTLSLRLLQPRLSPPDRRLRQSLSCSRNTLILSASGTWRVSRGLVETSPRCQRIGYQGYSRIRRTWRRADL